MPVVVCPNCQAKLNVKEEMLGRKGKCPKCATSIELQAAAVSPIQAEAPAPAPKSRRSPPPPLAAEIVDDDDEPELPSRRKTRRRADDFDDDDRDDREERVGDLDDEPRRKRRRDERYDDDDEDFDDRPGRRGRARGGWTGVRSGLQIVFWSIIALLGIQVSIQIASLFSPAAAVAAQGRGRVNMQNLAGGFQAFAAIVMVLGLGALVAYVAHFVGQCFCMSAPGATVRFRARASVYALVAAVVLSIIGFCVFTMMTMGAAVNMAQQAQQAQQNRQAQQVIVNDAFGRFFALGAIGLLGVVVVGALAITSWVFWILFHAGAAEAQRDRRLQSQCHLFLAASIIGPMVAAGVSFALMRMVPSFATVVVASLFQLAVYLGLGVWYLLINRRLVRLIDRAAGN